METIKTAYLRRVGHMKRMTDNRIQKKIYEWMPKGRMKRGRSTLTWTQGIAQTMRTKPEKIEMDGK